MAPSSGSQSLSPRQTASLTALIDAFFPPLPVPPTESTSSDDENAALQPKNDVVSEALSRYWGHRLSTDRAFLKAVTTSITDKMSPCDSKAAVRLLSLLSTASGTSLVFGHAAPYPFAECPVTEQTALLQTLQRSSLSHRRRVFQGWKKLLAGVAFSYTIKDPVTGEYTNPFWQAIGYGGPPQQSILPDEVDQMRSQHATRSQQSIENALVKMDTTQSPVSHLECDVVVVGSGAGGSVAASVLSEAGYHVLLVEKGSYVPPENISYLEREAMDEFYEQHGLLTTRNGAISVLAGSTLGGGTAINYSCCLPLPKHVQEEWFVEHELHDFCPLGAYERCLCHMQTEICSDRSVVQHNGMNKHFQRGCEALGFQWETCLQNLRDSADVTTGYVGLGDRYGNKQGGLRFVLKAAKHGTKILERCHVERVVTAPDPSMPGRRKRAVAVECRIGNHSVMISARKAVVLAAGALHTPCILQRSGFRNRHIGKHLRLHPVTGAIGFSASVIDCHLGAPLTTVCNGFEMGPAKNSYGAKMECPSAHPGVLAAGMQWASPQEFKERLLRYRHAVPLVLVQRDSGEGSVKASRDGKSLLIDYKVSRKDKESLLAATQGAIGILLAAGSPEVSTGHILDTGFVPKRNDTESVIEEYLSSVKNWGMKEHEISLFSAHQMGSCRMSSSPHSGVVDANGETWECNDLFVMDASVFPTASGANPMLTVMTIASMLSSRLGLMLQYRDGRLGTVTAAERAKVEELALRRTTARLRDFTEIAHKVRQILWTMMLFALAVAMIATVIDL